MQQFDDESQQDPVDAFPRSSRAKPNSFRRYIGTFRRHWVVALIPLLVLPLAGAYVARKTGATETATTSLWVDQDSVKLLGYADPQATPASNTAAALSQLLQTTSFDLRIAQESPLYWSTMRSKANLDSAVVGDLSKKVKVLASGPDLVVLSFSSAYRQMGVQLLRSLLKEAPGEIDRLNQEQARSSLAYYTQQRDAAQKRLNQVTQDLASYVQAHNISPSQMAAQELFDPRFAALYQTVQSAQVAARNADQQLTQANAAVGAGSAVQVIDPPAETLFPVSKKTMLLYAVIGLLVGILLSGLFIVITTARDTSLRYADEVPDLLGVPVLATIPFTPGLERKGRGG
jgi:hypothetical protein